MFDDVVVERIKKWACSPVNLSPVSQSGGFFMRKNGSFPQIVGKRLWIMLKNRVEMRTNLPSVSAEEADRPLHRVLGVAPILVFVAIVEFFAEP